MNLNEDFISNHNLKWILLCMYVKSLVTPASTTCVYSSVAVQKVHGSTPGANSLPEAAILSRSVKWAVEK